MPASSRFRFTLRQVWWTITALCLLLSVPLFWLLLMWLAAWLLPAVVVLGVLLLVQVPFYGLLRKRA